LERLRVAALADLPINELVRHLVDVLVVDGDDDVAVLGLHWTGASTAPDDEPPTRSIALPSEPGAARTARRFVEESLRAWQLDDNDHLAELLTDELVSNVVRHVGSPMQVRASRVGSSIRIEVDDASTDPPIRRTPEELDERGRGILLVDTIAAEWGVDVHDDGKTTWFVVPVGHLRAPGP
jgi:anti-sigma regulatory factor (Ser/Thr protein kinase)